MCPLDTVTLRSQGLNPSFLRECWCGPAATPTVEGVLPTKFPSISMSAPSGVEDTSNCLLCGRGWWCGRNEGRWLKLCEVQLHVTADVRRHLGPFGDCDILPMHEEKDWCRRPDDQAGGDHASGHYPGVTPSLALLHSAYCCLFSIRELDALD